MKLNGSDREIAGVASVAFAFIAMVLASNAASIIAPMWPWCMPPGSLRFTTRSQIGLSTVMRGFPSPRMAPKYRHISRVRLP